MKLGIVIVNYNNWKETVRCLESIYASEATMQGIHIYVVDNGSSVDMPAEMEAFLACSEITYIQSPENVGYAAGNNLGIRRAVKEDCDAVLISNNDVCFTRGSITGMYGYLLEHPKVGIVGPKVLDRQGNIQKSCMFRRTGLKEKYLVRTRLNMVFRKQHRSYFGLDLDYENAYPVYGVLGCCFMVSGDCVRQVFPFDEGTFLYEEEFIVGIRMEQAGYETWYVPDYVVHHLHGSSTGQVKPFAYTCETVSEIYYCRKYLEAKDWQIRPLYWYRILKYYGKCFRNKEFREYRKVFRKRVKRAFREEGKEKKAG